MTLSFSVERGTLKLAICLFDHKQWSGLSADFLSVAEEALQRGHQVHVITRTWEGPALQGAELTLLPISGLGNHARCQRFAEQALAILAADAPDLILGFNRMPGLDFYFAADESFIARAQQRHGALFRLSPRYRGFAKLERSVFADASATKIFSLAPRMKEGYHAVHGTPAERFVDVPPNVDLVAVGQSALRNAPAGELPAGWASADVRLLMVGSDYRTKGLDRSLRAIAELPHELRQSVALAVLGDGKPWPYMKLARELNLSEQLFFLGPRADVFDWMHSSDLLLQPSRVEAAGSVIVEALACGLTVLATSNCGFAHHVSSSGAGLVTPGEPFDQSSFNKALVNVLGAGQLGVMSQQAMDYAGQVSLSGRAAVVVDVLEAAVRG